MDSLRYMFWLLLLLLFLFLHQWYVTWLCTCRGTRPVLQMTTRLRKDANNCELPIWKSGMAGVAAWLTVWLNGWIHSLVKYNQPTILTRYLHSKPNPLRPKRGSTTNGDGHSIGSTFFCKYCGFLLSADEAVSICLSILISINHLLTIVKSFIITIIKLMYCVSSSQSCAQILVVAQWDWVWKLVKQV